MKITKNYLKKIIKEEYSRILKETSSDSLVITNPQDSEYLNLKKDLMYNYRLATGSNNEARLNKIVWKEMPQFILECLKALRPYLQSRPEALTVADNIIGTSANKSSEVAVGASIVLARSIKEYLKKYPAGSEAEVLRSALKSLPQ